MSSSSTFNSPILTSQNAKRLERLTLVSFNIAGCQPSAEAPRGWKQQDATDAIRSEVLAYSPDIIALQECPGGESWAMAHFLNYTVLGATLSHADHTILLVKKGIDAEPISLVLPLSSDGTAAVEHHHFPQYDDNDDNDRRHPPLPAVMAKLTFQSRTLVVASVHLAPFNQGESKRRLQIERLMNIAGSRIEGGGGTADYPPPPPLILAGDMNMRQSEDEVMEQTFQLKDFWRLAGSDATMKFTKDSINHGTSFNQYHGDLTREYNARYDRVYYHDSSCKLPCLPLPPPPAAAHDQVPVSNQNDDMKNGFLTSSSMLNKVTHFELMANKPVTNKRHFLSDHFGIATTFELDWPDA